MNTLRRGFMGADVVAWLHVLSSAPQPTVWTNNKGEQCVWDATVSWPLPTSFAFDKNLEAATQAWQFAHQLTADGVVGPATWAAAGVADPIVQTFDLVKGVDTSVIQGPLPVDAMKKDGIAFGWARCKVGNNPGRDSVFEQTMRAYQVVGIIRGGYCFPFPLTHLDPIEQAKMFLEALLIDAEVVGTSLGELPYAIDAEWPAPEDWAKRGCTPDQIVDFLVALMKYMEEQTGIKGVLYSYPYYLQAISKAKNYAQLMRYKLWLAGGPQYMNGNGQWPDLRTYKVPVVPGWGTDWLFNQWDGDGGRRLTNGRDADFNIFRYDLATLEEYCQVQSHGEQEPDTLPDMSLVHPATSMLIAEDGLHAYRQERANQFLLQPV